MTWLICFVHVMKKKQETLYILVGQVGKNPFSQLDNEKIMIFDANEAKFYFPEVP